MAQSRRQDPTGIPPSVPRRKSKSSVNTCPGAKCKFQALAPTSATTRLCNPSSVLTPRKAPRTWRHARGHGRGNHIIRLGHWESNPCKVEGTVPRSRRPALPTAEELGAAPELFVPYPSAPPHPIAETHLTCYIQRKRGRHLFWGHSRGAPQGMISDVQPLVKSWFWETTRSPNEFIPASPCTQVPLFFGGGEGGRGLNHFCILWTLCVDLDPGP